MPINLVPYPASLRVTIALPEMITAVNVSNSETFQYISILSLAGLM